MVPGKSDGAVCKEGERLMLRCCWENEGTERALGQKSAPMRASPRLAALIGGGPGCFRLNRENLASTPMRDCPRLSTPERMCIHLMVCSRPVETSAGGGGDGSGSGLLVWQHGGRQRWRSGGGKGTAQDYYYNCA